jgi:predicted SnoaL-like aldol condensation-catalyzing enzyme
VSESPSRPEGSGGPIRTGTGPDRTAADRTAALQALYGEVLARGRSEGIAALIAPAYRSHLPTFTPTPELLQGREALSRRVLAQQALPNAVRRLVLDGELAFVHVHYPGWRADIDPVSGVDIFRFEPSGLIAEHWCVRQPIPDDLSRGVDRYADAGLPAGRHRRDPAALRERVRAMLEQMWARGAVELVPHFYAEHYVQHNPDMPGGYARILEVAASIREQLTRGGRPFPIQVHRIGAQGDLVFVHLSILMTGINRNEGSRSTNVDIFRVDDDGRMVEHWDVLQMADEPLQDGSTLF